MTLLTLVTNDSEFLHGLRTDTRATLWEYGLALNPAERGLVENYLGRGRGLSDEEWLRRLLEEIGPMRW